MSLLLKIIPALIFWGIFGYIIIKVPYPQTLTQANTTQLLAFFIPLFLALSFTIDLLLNFYLYSASVAFGIIILLILKGLGALNLIPASLTIISIALLMSYFKKSKKTSLTSFKKIPKLTHLRKRNVSS